MLTVLPNDAKVRLHPTGIIHNIFTWCKLCVVDEQKTLLYQFPNLMAYFFSLVVTFEMLSLHEAQRILPYLNLLTTLLNPNKTISSTALGRTAPLCLFGCVNHIGCTGRARFIDCSRHNNYQKPRYPNCIKYGCACFGLSVIGGQCVLCNCKLRRRRRLFVACS